MSTQSICCLCDIYRKCNSQSANADGDITYMLELHSAAILLYVSASPWQDSVHIQPLSPLCRWYFVLEWARRHQPELQLSCIYLWPPFVSLTLVCDSFKALVKGAKESNHCVMRIEAYSHLRPAYCFPTEPESLLEARYAGFAFILDCAFNRRDRRVSTRWCRLCSHTHGELDNAVFSIKFSSDCQALQ